MNAITLTRRESLSAGLALTATAALPAFAQAAPDPDRFDTLVAAFMKAFDVPGIGIAIVRPAAPPVLRGYGIRRLGGTARVDADTLFGIASNSKAFVAASIAMLVEEGTLAWDAPVVRYMPDFAMHDAAATAMTTVRDLLCHRSGLPLGAGDLMQFPLSDHTRADIVRGLRYLPLERGFRSGYAYDNILYVVAGVLVERVSGMPWEAFVTRRLLQPLGMRTAVADRSLLRTANVVGRHARLGPPARGVGPLVTVDPDESLAGSPAGGIHASVTDMAQWLSTQLARGVASSGRRLWSEESAATMWTPQVITASGTGATAQAPTRPVMQGYALGWNVADYRGHRLVAHSGGLSGQVTQTALLPEQGIGIAVLTNTEDGVSAQLRNAILDQLLAAPPFDWLAAAEDVRDRNAAEVATQTGSDDFAAPPGTATLPLAAYAGRYRDAWYGDIVVAVKNGALSIDFTRTPVFKSALEPFGPDTFRTRFARGAGEDAVVAFVIEKGIPTRLKLRALSPLADFSYDFHHLAPVRVG